MWCTLHTVDFYAHNQTLNLYIHFPWFHTYIIPFSPSLWLGEKGAAFEPVRTLLLPVNGLKLAIYCVNFIWFFQWVAPLAPLCNTKVNRLINFRERSLVGSAVKIHKLQWEISSSALYRLLPKESAGKISAEHSTIQSEARPLRLTIKYKLQWEISPSALYRL